MAEEPGSTVPRRQLGRYVRQLREEAGITLDAAARELECSKQKVWRIENGAVPVRALDVKGMCELYGASREMTGVLVSLARETRSKGWWQSYGDAVANWFSLYIGLESAASRIRHYENELIPGLLQTREYAEAIFRLDQPDLPDDEREKAIAVRLHRQRTLARRLPPAPNLDVILSEAVLRQTLASSRVMVDQLEHLLRVTRQPNVSVQVLPLSAGPHRGAVGGAFVILDFPPGNNGRPSEPSTVYSESLTGALYLDKPAELAAYEQVWASLDRLALDEEESIKMITVIIGERTSE